MVTGRLPSDDTYIQADKPTTNYGAEKVMEVRPDNNADRRGLLTFNLSDIPTGAIITSARLYLYEQDEKPGQITYLYRVTRAWAESTATWGAPWTIPGGDFDQSIAYGLYLPNQKNCYASLDLTNLVQAWVNQDFPNYGVLLYSTGPNHIIQYTAKEETNNPERRPRLEVTYTMGFQRKSPGGNFMRGFLNWLIAFFGG
jgi:hypothetical protein